MTVFAHSTIMLLNVSALEIFTLCILDYFHIWHFWMQERFVEPVLPCISLRTLKVTSEWKSVENFPNTHQFINSQVQSGHPVRPNRYRQFHISNYTQGSTFGNLNFCNQKRLNYCDIIIHYYYYYNKQGNVWHIGFTKLISKLIEPNVTERPFVTHNTVS